MKLGILVVNGDQKNHLEGLARAALERGWSVKVFLNDDGVRLLEDPLLPELAQAGAGISFCETSARSLKIALEKVPRSLKRGTQLQHAMLHQFSDQIVVL
ncbi:MAG: hypothetical protein A2600_08610 [Candidatus Lambdaproteobacteria bacterium RIFOXYD1_FULL_56_27]|uniref:DsrE family protein n=1 Tax=Candidatus Lambdaproteobacteria bacterium RIFOXYD2_FULL_56_26 TaxID=1817773 RepID=A0A1F6GZ09_9PROT|nr:MAG: hypothetical protein A2426_10030 [Candidatus Lambdaproteobacteria bacterium RIFOXYC1_FULL_56_13]OGH03403.1 MAG: hypothetical protein A2557_02655 [Candidatus Lambdaproteobacteria bacterium RIFOXYD2_FULL_56_26]OGH06592.1 MAG: hypothetical protein A2600_08610 [Candidatus Lambdaproteobacteria bacterium RIFOXYD1_FULL_56_27]